MAKKITVLEACWALEFAGYEDGRTYFVENEFKIESIRKYYPCNGKPLLDIRYTDDSEISWAKLSVQNQRAYMQFFVLEGQPFNEELVDYEKGVVKEEFWTALEEGTL